MDQRTDAAAAFLRLVDIMAQLRAPGGCPWDREQTPQSAAPYVLEEAHEVVEAIDRGNPRELCEELGDLLLQVVFQSQMIADTSGAFTIADVATAISDKLVRRHPHVFGNVTADTSAEVLKNWEQIKQQEKPERTSIFDGLPKGLSALTTCLRLSHKASRVGFDWACEWPDVGPIWDKIAEERAEIDAARTESEIDHELGDLFFAVTQLARKANVDPEGALRRANQRFADRFQWIERQTKTEARALRTLSANEWETLWQTAKQKVSA